MSLLIRRVLPSQRDAVRADLTAMSSAISSGGPLQLGTSGKAVEALQRHLKAAGTYAGPVSGTFDAATQSALMAFQTAKKLPATGGVNAATFKALKEVNLMVKAGFGTAARVGQRGSDIAAAEKMMARLGFLSQDKADGVFDKATKAAVEKYRRADKQLQDTGALNEKFYSELKKTNAEWNHAPYRRRDIGDKKERTAHKRLDELTQKRAASPSGIGPGDQGLTVKNVERHLNAAGFNLGTPNGAWSSRTTAAVIEYQKRNGLPLTGVVDTRTWTKLRGAQFAAAGKTSPAQRVGEKSAAVLQTEKMLQKLGRKTGKVDGLFTDQTMRAVKAFQKKHHLEQTGAVNTRTLKAMQKATTPSGSAVAKKFMDLAKSKVGANYVFGAEGPNVFDCSGLIYWAFKQATGKSIPRLTAAGYQDYWSNYKVSKENLKPGDIVFFWYPNDRGIKFPNASHIEIYLGNGKTMGTDNTVQDAAIENIDWSAFVGGVRPPQLR